MQRLYFFERKVRLRAKGKYQEWLEPEGLLKIEGWARDGLVKADIAHNMGISLTTLKDWAKKYPSISTALKNGKEVADIRMENALYERGLGGVHTVKKTFKLKHTYYDDHGRKCEKEELVEGFDEVYIPGDTTAQIFWLKNRKPEQWRDKRTVDDNADNRAESIIQNMQTITDILQHPVSNRSIEDFEGVRENE